ncbi:chitosanase [Streptomyces sp. V3I7]|uniref:chitosanase n=1 Tax=Streptomyces sp. V3I7 TaxID=3042278 RepID=UPI0027802732|nr:chitosanase [Streptomyces sp. V3I7]MDQ0990317.1 chitosanase [Streptomyces sp. V3I7]
MKRSAVLLLAAVPVVVTAVVYAVSPGGPDPGAERDRPSAARSAGARDAGAADAKARAERARRAEDDALVADAPPRLSAPDKKELAQQILASAENSTLDWRSAFGYIEDIGDGQGYTAGLVGFCTGTHDLLTLVERYTRAHPDNGLARYLPALREVDGTDSHRGLDPGFPAAWKAEAELPAFRRAQEDERDRVYFDPAVRLAGLDGLGTLGQFVYYDAMVFHGPGTGPGGFYGLRERAMAEAGTPAEGGDETTYLGVFLDVRREAMRSKRPGIDTTRIDTAQRRFLKEGNLDLSTPLEWQVYGDTYRVP